MNNSPPRFGRLRVLWSFVAPHRGVLAVWCVLAVLSAAAGPATPMITKWVLDAVGSRASLVTPVATLLALSVFAALVRCLEWILVGTVGERVVLDARKTLVRRYFRATVPSSQRRPVGELVTRVTSDTVLLHEATSSSLIGVVNGTVMLVGTLVMMAVLDLALFAATIAAIAVVGALFLALMPGVAAERQRAQQRLGLVGGALALADDTMPQAKIKTKLQDIRVQRLRIETGLTDTAAELSLGVNLLRDALRLVSNPRQLYRDGTDPIRRLLNETFFERFYLDDPEVADDQKTPLFTELHDAHLAYRQRSTDAAEGVQLASKRAEHGAGGSKGSRRRKRPPSSDDGNPENENRLTLASVFSVTGSDKAVLVGLTGFEPATT
ncbi:ABC transporter transmembrane domain-containing protein [Nocardia transvalensis]|uniref:ABC transporter transmembrane domain-containing protein n=1 Tax=Nocardia transvalensis TaxID=37333 RepID=UPI0009FBFB70|nr:ABC transporter transmembrane domain-containing protein [Nocardia transvalensis]